MTNAPENYEAFVLPEGVEKYVALFTRNGIVDDVNYLLTTE